MQRSITDPKTELRRVKKEALFYHPRETAYFKKKKKVLSCGPVGERLCVSPYSKGNIDGESRWGVKERGRGIWVDTRWVNKRRTD